MTSYIESWDQFFVEAIEQGLGGKGSLSEVEREFLLTPMEQLSDSAKVSPDQAKTLNDRGVAALTVAYKQDTTGKNKQMAVNWSEMNKLLYKHSKCVVSGIVQNWYLSEGRKLEKKVVGLFSKPDW